MNRLLLVRHGGSSANEDGSLCVAAFLFDPQGGARFVERPLPQHVPPRIAAPITQPAAAPPPT